VVNQPLDLDAIEARANAATPGPWFNDSHEIYAGPHTDIPAMNEWIGETCDPTRPDHGAANAALAAWSRDGVPALVAEIRRLTAELAPYDALQLGHPDGRISTTCTAGKHPTWLRYPDDTRYYACPWCESERVTDELAHEQQRVAYWQECRDNYAAENRKLLAQRKELRAELARARQQNAHDPIECDHQAEAGHLAEQVKQLRAALHGIDSDAERAARKGYDLDAEDIRTTARNALNPAALSGA
jgi:hypothetical protein